MEEHLRFFRLHRVEEQPDMAILVLTQPADEGKSQQYIDQLIAKLKAYHSAQIPVTLIDAGNGRYGTAFHEALTKETELGRLLSYSGFLDMAIVTGTALSHGAARLACLQQDGERTAVQEYAFAQTLADSVLKDFAYKHIVRPELLDYVRGSGGNPDNFWAPEQDIDDYTARMAAGMTAAVKPLLDNFAHSNLITALNPYEEAGWGGIALSNYRFPWDRAFEIAMDIQVGEFTPPHEKKLGFWVQ